MLDDRPVVIAGPTASGKSLLASKLAAKLGSVVINADSRQVYKQMPIGTCVPSQQELSVAPHYLFEFLEIDAAFDVAKYLQYVSDLKSQNDWANPVFCGGSGLYIKALYEGINAKVSPEIRAELELDLEKRGLQFLVERLVSLDKEKSLTIDLNNPRRVMRALESLLTEEPTSPIAPVIENPILIAVSVNRDDLYKRINQRCEQMLDTGFLKEVELLFPYRHLKSLQTIGYKEFFLWMEGKYTLDEALEKMKQHTRNYAKRQITWFRNQGNFLWLRPEEVEEGVFNMLNIK